MKNSHAQTVTAYCNSCGSETKHLIVGSRAQPGKVRVPTNDGGFDVEWLTTYDMLECRGCSSVVIRRTLWSTEEPEDEVEFIPPPLKRRLPHWHSHLPEGMSSLLQEIYACIQISALRPAMAGARGLVDDLLLKEVGDVGTFPAKLTALQEKGVLAKEPRAFLEAALEAGHAALHRQHSPTDSEVHCVMDIVENLLQAVYVLPLAVKELKGLTPPRQRPKPQPPEEPQQ